MRFEHPLVLWLLVVIPPAMVLFFWQANQRRQALLAKFIQTRLLPGLLSGVSPARRRFREGLLVVAISLLVVALARPQWGFTWEEVQQRGLDIVAAIDTSKSMLAEDISPNRLQRAKLAALDLMQAAKTDRLGLVAFAGVAFLQCPLTIDDSAFRQSLDALDVNVMPQGGTALAEAINEALSAFKEENNYRVLVLFSDGEDHDSGALEAAQKAAEKGLRIFTVGIGSPEGEVLRVRDSSGRTDYVKDDQGNAVKSRLNEALLKDIAAATKGFYLPLEGSRTIETLYERGIAPLPRSEGKEKLVKHYHERYHWPLGLAILLLLAEILTPERPRERMPSGLRKSHVALWFLCCLLLPVTSGLASPGSALREYRSGNYDSALQEYQRLQKKKPDPRLNYNAGVAAYRDGQLEEATRQFGQALSAQDLELQEKAYFNRGNANYYLGEAAQEPQKRTQAWEQAIKDYQSSLKLNPKASDAEFNHEFVKRRLEELKQQQQQKKDQQDQNNQQDQQQSQKQNQGQKQPQDQQQQSQDQKSQEQNQQGQQQKAQEQQDQPGEESKQTPSQSPEPDEKQKEQPQPAEGSSKEEPVSEGTSETPADGKMSKAEARRLMDAQKGDEQILPMPIDKKLQNERRPRKDW